MPHKKKITLPKLAILVRNAEFFTSGDNEFDIITEYKRVANFWKYDVILTFISEQYMQEKEYAMPSDSEMTSHLAYVWKKVLHIK